MNRADLMLAALKDGQPKSRADLFALAGCFYLSNNAASELRARGYEVEHAVVDGLHTYRLSGFLTSGEPSPSAPVLPGPSSANGAACAAARASSPDVSDHVGQLAFEAA